MSKFDADELWNRFTPDQQNCIGVGAILFFASFAAELAGLSEMELQRWLHARETVLQYLGPFVNVPGKEPLREGPDLARVNIRACRECGCTDQSACEGGCYWVGEDLCSKCAQTEHRVAGHA